ncbi:MAG: hypothetical protein NTU83_07165 [Candidatus Hydrogenedentes bacterium]|nr:hypothetical protein [Candidatus Hydrogenedentota bacterium]
MPQNSNEAIRGHQILFQTLLWNRVAFETEQGAFPVQAGGKPA